MQSDATVQCPQVSLGIIFCTSLLPSPRAGPAQAQVLLIMMHLAAMLHPHQGSGQVTGCFPYDVHSPVSPESPAVSGNLITGEMEPV